MSGNLTWCPAPGADDNSTASVTAIFRGKELRREKLEKKSRLLPRQSSVGLGEAAGGIGRDEERTAGGWQAALNVKVVLAFAGDNIEQAYAAACPSCQRLFAGWRPTSVELCALPRAAPGNSDQWLSGVALSEFSRSFSLTFPSCIAVYTNDGFHAILRISKHKPTFLCLLYKCIWLFEGGCFCMILFAQGLMLDCICEAEFLIWSLISNTGL